MLNFLSDEKGAASAEYALIIVMIGLGLGVAVWGMASTVASSVGRAGARSAQAAGADETPAVSASAAASPPVNPGGAGGAAAASAARSGQPPAAAASAAASPPVDPSKGKAKGKSNSN